VYPCHKESQREPVAMEPGQMYQNASISRESKSNHFGKV
jgi:hypothetical protein